MRMPSLSQIASAVWGMVALASRTVTVTTNNDKAGYSAQVTGLDAGVITGTAIDTDAIGASEFSQGAADKVWASAARTLTAGVTVTTNNDKAGYSLTTQDWNVGKTGYSLTAGSYSVRASSTQVYTIVLDGVTENTAAIASVTVTRARINHTGHQLASATAVETGLTRHVLTSSTVVTASRGVATNRTDSSGAVVELL